MLDSRFGPDLVQIQSRSRYTLVQIKKSGQHVRTCCLDSGPCLDWSRPHFTQSMFFAKAAPLVVLLQPPPPSQIMPRGRAWGVANYKNAILINIVSNMLPNSKYAWQAIATAYQAESGEKDRCDMADLKKHLHKVLCNCGKKPTGKPGAINDRIFCCIAIERQILKKTNSGMMGASSIEDKNNLGFSSTENSEVSDDDDDKQGDGNCPKSWAKSWAKSAADGDSSNSQQAESVAPDDLVGDIVFATSVPALPPLPLPLEDPAASFDGAAPAVGGEPHAPASCPPLSGPSSHDSRSASTRRASKTRDGRALLTSLS
jgi:hypothetical protein